jgi:processive 1,2-diacylglycerol beta-glucosyltransferase
MDKEGIKNKIFIYSESIDGSYYYRGEVFKRFSKNFIITTNVDFKNNYFFNEKYILNEFFSADAIVFIRPFLKENLDLLKLLKKLGKTIICDIDDLFFEVDKENPIYLNKKQLEVHEKFIIESDGIITTTEGLKKEYSKLNNNTFVVSNYLDFEDFSIQSIDKKDELEDIRIAISGSSITAENISDDFLKMLKGIYFSKKNIRFIFFGGDEKTKLKIKKLFNKGLICVDPVPFYLYNKKLNELRIDFCLIPRKENKFNECKSNCKFLEMSAQRIPIITNDFTYFTNPYKKDLQEGKNGIIVRDINNWKESINKLINDEDFRSNISENAFDYTKDNYDIAKNIQKWEAVIFNILKSIGSKKFNKDDVIKEIKNTLIQRSIILKELRVTNDKTIKELRNVIKKNDEMIIERDNYIKELNLKLSERKKFWTNFLIQK